MRRWNWRSPTRRECASLCAGICVQTGAGYAVQASSRRRPQACRGTGTTVREPHQSGLHRDPFAGRRRGGVARCGSRPDRAASFPDADPVQDRARPEQMRSIRAMRGRCGQHPRGQPATSAWTPSNRTLVGSAPDPPQPTTQQNVVTYRCGHFGRQPEQALMPGMNGLCEHHACPATGGAAGAECPPSPSIQPMRHPQSGKARNGGDKPKRRGGKR